MAGNVWEIVKNDDDSYFQDKDYQSPSTNKNKEVNISNLQKQESLNLMQIEPYIPLNNFLESGDFRTQVEWKSSFDGGKSGGIGQQNNSFRLDYGISEGTLFSTYFAEADDDYYNYIKGARGQYHCQNYAFQKKC